MGLFDFLFNKRSKPYTSAATATIDPVELPQDIPLIDSADEVPVLPAKKGSIRYLYEHPETLVDIEFFNRANTLLNIWVEIACVSIDLDNETEYKILTHDRSFRLEFDNDQIVFYLQYSFGFKLYKRRASDQVINNNEWILDYDCSDIN